ncbi:MAG: hypothetical protein Q9219_007237 [cf. Caloplaca sp. 3 TL-2023]
MLILLSQKRSAQWVQAKLKSHMLFQDDQETWAKYPLFREHVHSILNQNRKSEVAPVEAAEYQEMLKIYHAANEDTFLGEILPFLIKSSRTVTSEGSKTGSNATKDAEMDSAVVAWYRSGMRTIWNREYKRTFLSFRDGQDADDEMVAAMQKEDKVTNPKPDRIFAIASEAAPFPEGFRIPEEIDDYLEIVPGTHNPHALLEGKSMEGNILDARNQACRGGAALVLAHRLLRETIGMPNEKGPDKSTMVFSVTLSPSVVEVWVHWALAPEDGGKLKFHMNCLAQKAIAENLGGIRRVLHNILDWGCGTRQEELKKLYEEIVTYTEKKEADAQMKSPARKKLKMG